MARMKLDFSGFDETLQKLDRLGADSKKIAEEACKVAVEVVNPKAEAAMSRGNLPAGGKYSDGRTLSTLQRNARIKWQDTVATVDIGFNIRKGGLPSVFLMYGTPKMRKVQALYDAFYSTQTEGEIINRVKELLAQALEAFE